jgi:F-box interacting protein
MWNKHVTWANRLVFEHVVLEIDTLVTTSWRNLEVDPQISFLKLLNPTCVNGGLHWIIFEDGQQNSMSCFSFESERMQSFPSPPHMFGYRNNKFPHNMPIRLGELKGFLYICDRSSSGNVTMWVMNEYVIGESWTKVHNIDTYLTHSGLPKFTFMLRNVSKRHLPHIFLICLFKNQIQLLN